MASWKLVTNPVHLGLGATADVEPEFSGGLDWYESYGQRHAADGPEGRLVSMHTFDGPWDTWEMHPRGHEVVVCLDGEMTLIQETPDGTNQSVSLKSGEYSINAPGVWHTADIERRSTALFITAGECTIHRPRQSKQ